MSRLQSVLAATEKIKRPGKKEAYNIIKNLIRNMDEAVYADNFEHWVRLFSFFLPPVPKRPKTDFEWVALSATTKDGTWLRHVHVIGDKMYGCSGHTMHVAPNSEDLSDGAYCPRTQIRAGDVTAPVQGLHEILDGFEPVAPVYVARKYADYGDGNETVYTATVGGNPLEFPIEHLDNAHLVMNKPDYKIKDGNMLMITEGEYKAVVMALMVDVEKEEG